MLHICLYLYVNIKIYLYINIYLCLIPPSTIRSLIEKYISCMDSFSKDLKLLTILSRFSNIWNSFHQKTGLKYLLFLRESMRRFNLTASVLNSLDSDLSCCVGNDFSQSRCDQVSWGSMKPYHLQKKPPLAGQDARFLMSLLGPNLLCPNLYPRLWVNR